MYPYKNYTIKVPVQLKEQWESADLLPKKKSALVRAMMNRLLEEEHRLGPEGLHNLLYGNFSLEQAINLHRTSLSEVR